MKRTTKRNAGFMLLGFAVLLGGLGGSVLSQTLQGAASALGTLVMVLVVACFTYAGVRLVTQFHPQPQGETQSEPRLGP